MDNHFTFIIIPNNSVNIILRKQTWQFLLFCPSAKVILVLIGQLFNDQVLDLSFNDFKGPGFEPLGNCQVLQVSFDFLSCTWLTQLYLARLKKSLCIM